MLKLIDESLSKIKEGEIVEGKIVNLSPKEVIVDVGLKSEGVIPLSEFDDPSKLKLGDKFEVFIENIEGEKGSVVLSKSKADSMRVWESIEDSYKNGTPIEGKISMTVKGGFVVNAKGIECFLPNSQFDVVEIKDTSKLVGETFNFKVTKFDKLRESIVLSRRAFIEKELKAKREKFWETAKEELILDGVVKNIADFGAFVDIGGVDGLVHITDLSWSRINHPSEVLQQGDKVKVKILSIDRETHHVALGIKQLTQCPWDGIEERYPVASKVKVKVTSLADFGAFVELEPGVEGLIHISEMSWTQRIRHPSQILAVGETVQAVILNINKDENKISLGIRQIQANPWKNATKNYPEGSIVSGTVKAFSPFGAFVELKDGIEGLLHIRDLSWTEHIEHPSDILKKGKRIKCSVLSLDAEHQRITFGLKQLEQNPLLTLEKLIDKPVKGIIKEIVDKGVVVKLKVNKHKVEGFIPVSHLAKPDLRKIENKYKIGEELNLKFLEIDAEQRKVILSEKDYYKAAEKKEYEEYLKKQK